MSRATDTDPPPFLPSSAIPRAALVTGAGRRIGRAIAEALGADGWAVAVHYHGSQDEAEATAERIRARGGRAQTVRADLSCESEVETLLERAAEVVGPLGVLVNNASVFEHDAPLTVSRESWDRHMETNLRAPFVLMQSFARLLPEKAEGVIVNIVDQRVWCLPPSFTSYTLSKAGLWTLTQTLALAFAPRIRVNAIGPGPTLPSPRQSEEQFLSQSSAMPLGHGTSLSEIVAGVRFVLAARGATGQMIALDGGQHLGWTFPDASHLAEE